MDAVRLSKAMLLLGALITAGALIWWMSFYGAVVRQFPNASLKDALPCLYSNGGPCGFIGGLAQMGGYTPYSPISFWLGGALLIAGVIARLTAADGSNRN